MDRLAARAAVGIAALCLGVIATGCAHLPADLDEVTDGIRAETAEEAPREEAPAPPPEDPASQATSPIRVTLDGVPERPADQWGIYWNTERRVSTNPEFVLTMGSELGDFEMLIINVYATDDEGIETGSGWAITDFGGEQVLAPGRSVNLASPEGATIIAPDGRNLDSIPLESGETYVALFVVRGTEGNHTHKVRFTVR